MTYNMSVSNVPTISVTPNAKVEESFSEKIQQKWDNMETGEKAATVTISGLTLLGGIMLAVHAIKKGKVPTEAPKIPTGTVPTDTSRVVPAITPKPISTHIEIAHTPKAQRVQQAVEQGTQAGKEAVEKYNQGGNYAKIRRETARNMSKPGKKTAKGLLSEAHSKKVAADIAAQHKNSANLVSTFDSNKAIEKANQGMKTALPDEARARAIAAKTSAQKAQDAAAQVQKVAQEKSTHKNIKRATIAQNQANQARLDAEKVKQNSEKRLQAIANEIEEKKINRAQMMASPGYEAGLAKQETNAQKAAAKKVDRDLKKITGKPEYKRMLDNFQRKRYSKEKLLSIYENPKSSDIEYLAAQELLERITK